MRLNDFGAPGQLTIGTGDNNSLVFAVEGKQYFELTRAGVLQPVSGSGATITPQASGQLLVPDGTTALPGLAFASDPDTGMYRVSANRLAFVAAGTTGFELNGTTTLSFYVNTFEIVPNAGKITFGTAADTVIKRDDASGVLALINGTTQQTLRIYGTTTGSKYIQLTHDGTNALISTTAGLLLTGPDPSEVVAATNVITAAESGTTFFLSSATEFVSTLPAPALGLHYRFIVTAAPSGASYTIVTAGAPDQILVGGVHEVSGGAGDAESTLGATTITFVDGQAKIGDWAEVISDGTNWYARVYTNTAGAATFTG